MAWFFNPQNPLRAGIFALSVASLSVASLVACDQVDSSQVSSPRTETKGYELSLSSGGGGGNDPCKDTTLVTFAPPRVTAGEFCDALKSHTGGLAVYNTQCFGGGVVDCCIKKGVKGFFGSGGLAGETQSYGQYDEGVAGGLRPGANTGDVHNGGAGNVNNSTPQSAGRPGPIPSGAHVITFGGQPTSNGSGGTHEGDHNDTIDGNFGDANTTTLTGDGTGEDGPGNWSNLKDAIRANRGKFLVIYIDDHGNKGKRTAKKTVSSTTTTSVIVELPPVLWDQTINQRDSNPALFISSDKVLPEGFEVQVNGQTKHVVTRGDIQEIKYSDGTKEYRAVLPVSHAALRPDNVVSIDSRFEFEAEFMIDVEIAKANARGVLVEPLPNSDVRPEEGDVRSLEDATLEGR